MTEEARINVNTADAQTLMQLRGVHAVVADRIIERRAAEGPFTDPMQLAEVKGISERMVRAWGDRVAVEDAAERWETAVFPSGLLAERSAAVAAPDLEAGEFALEALDASDVAAALPEDAPDLEADEFAPEAPDAFAALESAPGEGAPEPAAGDQVEAAAPEAFSRLEIGPEATPDDAETAAAPAPQPPARVGYGLALLAALLGTVLGAALSLIILAAINGGALSFSRADAQLQRDLDAARRAQSELQSNLEGANRNLSAVATRVGGLAQAQRAADATMDGVQREVQAVQTGIAATQDEVAALEETAVALDRRLGVVAAAAETFDTFLNGLRDLLVELQGTPEATATSAPTVTPTPAEATAVPSPTPDATGRATATPFTPSPTRTPRPTPTLLPLPTMTPAQQP